jgi:hypothetical protein
VCFLVHNVEQNLIQCFFKGGNKQVRKHAHCIWRIRCVILFKNQISVIISKTIRLAGNGLLDIKHVSQFSIKVKVKLTLEQAMKAQRGSRGIALLFL